MIPALFLWVIPINIAADVLGDDEAMKPEDRAQEIVRLVGPKVDGLLQAAVKLTKAPVAAPAKRIRFIEIADKLSRTISPHTACRRGCSECCAWSLRISSYEARLIGRHVGREPKRLDRKTNISNPGVPDKPQVRHYGVPCPFLKPGPRGCSIYAVRPFACRLHHSLMDDESSCRVRLDETGKALNRAASLDFSMAVNAWVAIFAGEDFGDIREFFPPER